MSRQQGLGCGEAGQELVGIRMRQLDRVLKLWLTNRWTNLSTDKVIALLLRNVRPWISRIIIQDLRLATKRLFKLKPNLLQMEVQANLSTHRSSNRCQCGINRSLVLRYRTRASTVTPEISLIRLLIYLLPQTKIRWTIKDKVRISSSRSRNLRTQYLQTNTQTNLGMA